MSSKHTPNRHPREPEEVATNSFDIPVDDASPFVVKTRRPPSGHDARITMGTTHDHRDNAYNPFLVSRPSTSIEEHVAIHIPRVPSESRTVGRDPSSDPSARPSKDPSFSAHEQHAEDSRADGDVTLASIRGTASSTSSSVPDGKRVQSRSTDALRELNKEMKATRIELKAWEADFLAFRGRPPTQADIAMDEVMVKKYRAYGKLKKAIAALSPSDGSKDSSSSSQPHRMKEPSSSSSTTAHNKEPPRTPKKSQRTSNPFLTNGDSSQSSGSTSLCQTPSKKAAEQIEYISSNVIGLMSPRRSRRTQDDSYYSPSTTQPSRPTPRDSVVSSSSRTPRTPRTSRTVMSPSVTSPASVASSAARLLFSPRKSSNLRSAGTPKSRSLESIEETQESSSSYVAPRTPSRRPRTPSRYQRTPTSHPSESGFLDVNPFLSPLSRPTAKSPLFGGMNRSKKRTKLIRTPSELAIMAIQSQERSQEAYQSRPSSEMGQDGEAQDIPDLMSPRSPHSSNPLLLTPRRSAASKASRSLFRHTSSTDLRVSQRNLMSPSRKSVARRHPDFNPFAPRPLNPDDFLFDSAADALDSMSIHDSADQESLERDSFFSGSRAASPSERHRSGLGDDDDQHWVDEDEVVDPSKYSPVVASPIARSFPPRNVSHGINASPSGRQEIAVESRLADYDSEGRNYGVDNPWIPTSPSSPRGSDQMPSLTFSQPSQSTLFSPGSDNEFLFVAPGIHAHHQHRRRRHIGRSILPLSFSQMEDGEFSRQYLSEEVGKDETADPLVETKQAVMTMANSFQDNEGESFEAGDYSDDDEDLSQKMCESNTGSSTRARKKTQKRTTKLHKIVVTSSKSTTVTTMRKSKRNAKAMTNGDTEQAGTSTNDVDDTARQEQETSLKESLETVSTTTKESSSTSAAQSAVTNGWANSNKPLAKSARSYQGVGNGRAGARRTTSSNSYMEGNYVAYNLQRNKGRLGRGGYRGSRSRVSGPLYGSSQQGSGMSGGGSRFDNASWRTEFDQDLPLNSGLVSNLATSQPSMLLDEHIGDLDDLLEPEQEILPWYGKLPEASEDNQGVDDDPLVASISARYLPNGSQPMKVNLGHILRRVWGYSSFRDGQLESIKRVLNNESTLLVLPTGGGKSLSYQLPAYVFSKLGIPSLTLVVSPMISLMYDQVKCLPPGLIGACWTSVEQTDAQFRDFMAKLEDNTIKILFISPEKLSSPSFLSLVESARIPKISFLCVDEVHCLSEWSHNFRPAYLMLDHVLKTQLGSPCVLGLTGTATEATKDSICAALDIDRSAGVLSGPVIRKNLAMSVSLEDHREEALLNMLRSPRFMNMDAILIYVMKQSQADHLAAFLRVRNFNAESYHAGKSPQDRQRIQERFMHGGSSGSGTGGSAISGGGTMSVASQESLASNGSTTGTGGTLSSTAMGGVASSQRGIRILCATIAFGMGLNKSNIRSVIHFCMPKSLENYIQEIGRSGRDGRQSYCHMFLSQEDYLQLRSLSYADGMDYEMLRWFLHGVFAWTVPESGDPIFSKSSAGRKDSKGLKKRTSTMSLDNDGGFAEELLSVDDGETPPSKKVRQNSGRSSSVKSGSGHQTTKQQKENRDTAALLPKCIIPVTDPEERLAVDPRENVYREMLPTRSLRANRQRRRWVIVKEEQAEQEFDLKKEVLATLMSYLELDRSGTIKCHGTIQTKCVVKVVQSEDRLVDLDQKSPLLDWIIRRGVKTAYRSSSTYVRGGRSKDNRNNLSMGYACDTMHVCQTFDISHHELYQELQKLRRQKWIVFEMNEPGWLLDIVQDPVQMVMQQQEQQESSDLDVADAKQYMTDFVDHLSSRLYQKVCAVERAGVAKVDEVYKLFHSVATPTWQMHPALEPRPSYKSTSANDVGGAPDRITREVTEPEIVLIEGIEEYFARTHGEGISDVFEEMKTSEGLSMELDSGDMTEEASSAAAAERAHRRAIAERVGKTMTMYNYQPPLIQELQRNWRMALEVDLRVFLSQQMQQLGDDWLQWQADLATSSASSLPTPSLSRTTVAQPPTALRMLESPRVVTRIFHGISSPCFPAMVWARQGNGATQYWAKYGHFDFATLMQMANRVLKELKVKYKLQAQSQRRSH